jgi:hypothetical protein
MLENDDEPCLLSDAEILRGFERERRALEQGDHSAFRRALAMCARYQAVMPDWLADRLLTLEKDIERGQHINLNKCFGHRPDSAKSRRKELQQKERESVVTAALLRHRIAGASFDRGGEDSVFDVVGREIGISRRIVVKVYQAHPWLKDVKQGNPEGHNFGFGNIVLARGRRRGRSIF